jgi:hypothetical protein
MSRASRAERCDPARILRRLLLADLPGLYTVSYDAGPHYLRVPVWTHPRFVRLIPSALRDQPV